MTKGKLFAVFLAVFLVLSIVSVSADLYVREEIDKSYTQDYDVWVYKEDLKGDVKGFSLTHYSNSPKYSYEYEDEQPYYSWGGGWGGGWGSSNYRVPFSYLRYQGSYQDYNKGYNLNRAFDVYGTGKYRTYPRYSSYGGYTNYYTNYW